MRKQWTREMIRKEREKERGIFLWTTWYKLRKFKMKSTMDVNLDLEILKYTGIHWLSNEAENL